MKSPFVLPVLLVAGFFLILGVRAEGQGATPAVPAKETYPPAPTKYFNDYAGITNEETQETLNGELTDFDRKTTNQVFVAIFKKKESNAPLEEYCARVYAKWGVGRNGKNNGVILFIFMDDHSMRMATGWDMGRVLPDDECKRIIDEIITPAFKKQNYNEGLTAAVDAILKTIRNNSFSTAF